MRDFARRLLLIALAGIAGGEVPARAAEAEIPRLDLRIDERGWGNAPVADVRALLESNAAELLRYFPGRKLEPIRVSARGGPIVLFERAPDGAVVMRLNTGDTYWSQYAFQFSHELCHVLCRYDTDPTGQKWFEESLCETASLFCLRRMAESWKTKPPYENWKSYAPHLAKYAAERIDAARLPAGKTLPRWYAENADALAKNATDRDRNNIVAGELLPLFEAEPKHWAAVQHLNDSRPEKPRPFVAHLQDWRDHAPAEHRAFIDKLARKFEITLTAAPAKTGP